MNKGIFIYAAALLAAAAATSQEDPIIFYWESVNDITYRFTEKLQEAQPYLAWPDTKDQKVRDDIFWKIGLIAKDLKDIKREFDTLSVPTGFESSQSLISNSLELYITGLSRVAQGIQMSYTKIFNGGIVDIGTAADLMDQGYFSLSEDMRAAGYKVE